MQLFEVKNDIAKILYNPAENHLLPADFLLLEDVNQKLIAQVINISTTDASSNVADVRFALSVDKEDNLSYYNGHIPSKSSKILYINPDEIMELIKGSSDSLYLGNLANHSDCFVKPGISFINDLVYVQSDREDKSKIFLQNVVSELSQKEKKVVIIDFDGRYSFSSNVAKLKVSEAFKLPLNIDAFNTILEYDTVDCPIEDKAVIQSIVLELREYLNTLENKFLPFTLFRSVVDNEFMANPISGLMLLRNKLWLYSQESIFAESKTQFELINKILENQDVLVIDASCLEEKWYKFAIQTIASLIDKKAYFVLSLNDVPMDKKSIMALYNSSNILPIVSTSYDSPYRTLLKSLCKNQILFKPSFVLNDEEHYAPLLNKINSGEFIAYGESTLFLPFVLELQTFDSGTSANVIINEIKKDVDKFFTSSKTLIPTDVSVEDVPSSLPIQNNPSDIDDDINDSDFDFLEEEERKSESISIEDFRNKMQSEPVAESKYDLFNPENSLSVEDSEDALELVDDVSILNSVDEKSSVNEQDSIDSHSILDLVPDEEETVTNDNNGSFDENIQIEQDIIKQEECLIIDDSSVPVHADFDKDLPLMESDEQVQDSEYLEEELKVVEEQNLKEVSHSGIVQNADISENDDEKVDEEVDEEDLPPPLNENISVKSDTNNLPVYDVTENIESDEQEIPFKIGDKVYHPKHGYGVVEGFANYSDKMLFCQIAFEDVGRRILDPRVTEIEKVE